MAFPDNPSLGDRYTQLNSVYEWFGLPNGWQRVTTSAVRSYFPENEGGGIDLDDVRTDSGNTAFTYNNGRLTQVSRPGLVKDMTYDGAGKLVSLTITTDDHTVVKTFGYTDSVLTSITIS